MSPSPGWKSLVGVWEREEARGSTGAGEADGDGRTGIDAMGAGGGEGDGRGRGVPAPLPLAGKGRAGGAAREAAKAAGRSVPQAVHLASRPEFFSVHTEQDQSGSAKQKRNNPSRVSVVRFHRI
jgi:hypothetical protein